MTKQNIIDIVSDATGLTKVETEAVMNGVMKTIIDSLAENERVELRGFGTFGVKHRMPKKARNPWYRRCNLSSGEIRANIQTKQNNAFKSKRINKKIIKRNLCPVVKSEKSVK